MKGQTDRATKRNLVLTCTNTENIPYTSHHTGYNGQCAAAVLSKHPEPQRQSFAANSDNTDSYYRISHASADTWRQRQNGISVLANVHSVMCTGFNQSNSMWSSHLEFHSFGVCVNWRASTIQVCRNYAVYFLIYVRFIKEYSTSELIPELWVLGTGLTSCPCFGVQKLEVVSRTF
jgi:hypothetical protein